jgi:hypothetical protein
MPSAKRTTLVVSFIVWLDARVLRSEKRANRNVFIDVIPVDADATADEPPLRSLRRGSSEQPWKPLQRGRDAATVSKSDKQLVVGARHIDGICHRLTG